MSPTIALLKGLRFHFYSKEHAPVHLHIDGNGKSLKINLQTLEVVINKGFSDRDANRLLKLVKKEEKNLLKHGVIILRSFMKSKKNEKDILSEEDIESKNIKWRLTTMIDLDVLDEIKAQAKKKGLAYQTLINSTLRDVFINKTETRVKALDELNELKKYIESEKFFLKNKHFIKKAVSG